MNWNRVDPVFPVADVTAAIGWYGRVLGFEPQFVNSTAEEVPVYALIKRGAVALHILRMDEAPHGLRAPVQAQFWITSDLDDLFRQVESHGVEILQSPEAQPWGHRDFMIRDPDGNVVWVTQPL
jgi:uncharacterized glyoxalase superfamily protein PhnB